MLDKSKELTGGGPQGREVCNHDNRCLLEHGAFPDPTNEEQRSAFAVDMSVWLLPARTSKVRPLRIFPIIESDASGF